MMAFIALLLFLIAPAARAQISDDGSDIQGKPAESPKRNLQPGELPPDEEEEAPAKPRGKRLAPGDLPEDDDGPLGPTAKPPRTFRKAEAFFQSAKNLTAQAQLVAFGPWIRVARVTAKAPDKGAVNFKKGLNPDKYRGTIVFRHPDPATPAPGKLLAALSGVGTERPAEIYDQEYPAKVSWEIKMERDDRRLRCVQPPGALWILCAGSSGSEPPTEYAAYLPKSHLPEPAPERSHPAPRQ